MANTPVPAKQPASTLTGTPEIWQALRSEVDRLFDRFTGGLGILPFAGFRPDAVRFPAVDITEDEKAFKLSAELPGMTEKDVEVSLSGDMLLIKGEKSQAKEQSEKGYSLSERSYGAFQRSFVLPEGVDAEKIDASVANGVLTVTVPKNAVSMAKKIEVKAAA